MDHGSGADCSLVFSGCRGGSGSGSGGNGGSGEPGEIDLTACIGTWVSPAHVDPSVEFTITEFIESTETLAGTKHHHFKGSVRCTQLDGGEIEITDKQDLDLTVPRVDTIHVAQGLLYVKAGHDTMEGGTVDLGWGQWEGNNLRFYVSIEDEGQTIYETESGLTTDVFTKKN